MSRLFEPLTIGALTLPNRIVIAPMCQYSASEGTANDWHLIHLGHLALSGAGLMILEATAVTPEGRISPGDLGLYSDENEAALARVLAAIRAHSPMPIAIQLGHAGRKGSSRAPWDGGAQIRPDEPSGWKTLAPSTVPHNPGEDAPAALDGAGLDRLREAFAAAARRAARLGFEGIELHGAHGYLLHQFLSPISHRRDDAYGGSLENRMRFPLEVFEAVRAAVPATIPVWVRLSATDWVEGGWDGDDTVRLAALARNAGVDLVDTSTGGNVRADIPVEPGYQVPFARRIRTEADVPSGAVGLITEPKHAEEILAEGSADVVLLARELLRDPHWPLRAAYELGEADDDLWPVQYRRAAG